MGPEVIAGQLWVNAKIRELAEGKEPMVQAFEWEDPSERNGRDFIEGTIGLAIFVGAQRRVIRFLESELADVEGDQEVQRNLSDRLRKALQ
jgi:hypothetical protein